MPEEGNHKITANTEKKGVNNVEYNYSSKWYSQEATIGVRKGKHMETIHTYVYS